MQKTSEEGARFIAAWEGLVLNVYDDVAGVKTIGYGHALKKGESFPNGITEAQALEILQADLRIAEDSVSRLVKVDLTQEQFDALVSFTFNVGTGAFAKSTLLRVLNSGDKLGAADQMLRWTKAGGKQNAGLLNRRKAERERFTRCIEKV